MSSPFDSQTYDEKIHNLIISVARLSRDQERRQFIRHGTDLILNRSFIAVMWKYETWMEKSITFRKMRPFWALVYDEARNIFLTVPPEKSGFTGLCLSILLNKEGDAERLKKHFGKMFSQNKQIAQEMELIAREFDKRELKDAANMIRQQTARIFGIP